MVKMKLKEKSKFKVFGFTLTEMLTTIVVLSIVALIVTPIIIMLIEKT